MRGRANIPEPVVTGVPRDAIMLGKPAGQPCPSDISRARPPMTQRMDEPRFIADGLGAAILDSAHALVVTLDVEGRIAGFNRACELLTGYGASEVIGTYLWDTLLPEEAVESIRQFFASLPKDGDIPKEHENAWVTRDGRRPIIAWNNSVLRNANGAIELVVGIGVDITERKATSERLAHAQRIARIGSWEWTIETDKEEWSDQFFINLGLKPGSVKSSVKEFYKYVHPHDRDAVKRNVLRSMETKQPYNADYRVIWPDGTERLVHEEVEAILDGDGKAVALAGTMQDVTDLRETENQLQRLTRSLANAQRIAHIGNWDWDAVTKAEWWSDEVYRIMGLEPGSVTPGYESFMERIHPDDKKRVGGTIEAAQNSLGSYDVDFRIVRIDGEVRVVHETGERVLDAAGHFTGLTGTVQDITGQHKAEHELSETAQRLKAAMRLARLGDWEWDPDTNLLKLSEETLRICGLGPEHAEVNNEFLMAMIPAEEHARVLDVMNRAVSTDTAYTNEYHIVRPNGDRRTVLEHGEAFHDETTGRTRLVGTVQDITERQRAEEELGRTLKRLADSQTAARIGSWEWDAATDQDWWSEQQFRNYGIEAPAGFVPGEKYLHFAHPADREAAKQAVYRSVETGAPLDMEFRATGADGVERVLWVHGVTETNADGRVIRTVGTTQDVTVRQHAEQELARTTGRLEEAQRIANIGHWEWRSGSTDTIWSDETHRIFGLEPGAIQPTHDSFFGMVHEDDRESIATMMADTLETGQSYATEFRIIRTDGAMRHIFERGERYIDEETGETSIRGIMQDITERKIAEEKLRETAINLEKSQRIAKLGSWVWEIEEDKEWWSDEIYRMLGWKVEAKIEGGYDYLEYVHPDDREHVRAALDKSLRERVPYAVEYRTWHADGHEITLSEHAETEYDEAGKLVRMRGTTQDITERKQAEEKIRQSNWYLDLFFKHSLTSFILMDRNFNFIRVNDAYAKADGKEPGFFPGKNHFDIYPSEAKALFAEVRDSGKPYQALAMPFEYAEHPKRGTTWWDWTLVPVADQDGATELMVFSLNNVTERVQTEQALRDSEERLNAFFTEAPAGLGIIDSDYRYVKLNETLARMNGLSAQEQIGKQPSEFLPPEMAEMVMSVIRRTLEGEALDHEEGSAPGPDGQIHHWVFSQFPIAGDPRKPDALGLVIVDVSELKNTQQELMRLNAELEQRVEERTAELHTAQKELVKSERLSTLGQLTATVSHELRNPLGAMRTSMYVVEKKIEVKDQRLQAAIERVNRNITRCDQIIDELLDFTRIRDLDIQQTDIDNWLGAILDEQSIPNEIAVKRKFGVADTHVSIDANRLRRAFINVFENACQAVSSPHHAGETPARPLVTVETRLKKDRLEIIISDNGAGIPDDIREKIFEPLFSTKNFGVGLGLPTVKQIMAQHGGGVEIAKRRGGGVNFALWLPLAGELQSTNL